MEPRGTRRRANTFCTTGASQYGLRTGSWKGPGLVDRLPLCRRGISAPAACRRGWRSCHLCNILNKRALRALDAQVTPWKPGS